MKHYFFLLLFLQISAELWTLEFGIDTEQKIIFHEKSAYIPATSSILDTSLFVRYIFYGKWNYLNFTPMVKMHTDILRFGFYELDASFYINDISLSLGKNNFYFGDGISRNIFFPISPASPDNQISKQKFWNMRFNTIIHPLALSLGYIADTESIDNYSAPKWHSIYSVIDYSMEAYSFSFESDIRFTGNDVITGKTAFASKLLFAGNFSIYNTIASKYGDKFSFKNSFSIITGISKYFSLNPLNFTSILESSYAEYAANMTFYQNIEYKELVFTASLSAFWDLNTDTNTLKPQTTLEYYISGMYFEISYTFGSLLAENKFADSVLFLGINYDIN
jgi:hypothetical protein